MSLFFFIVLILACLEGRARDQEIPDLLRIIPEDSREYDIFEMFSTRELLKEDDNYQKDMILTVRDAALLTVLLVIKVDEIRDYGLEYYLNFQELKDLLYLVNAYAGEISLLFPDRIERLSEKVTRLEKRLNLEVKITDGQPSE